MQFIKPNLSLAQHIGLYSAFHRTPKNRNLHQIGIPLVILSGLIACSYLSFSKSTLPLANLQHLGTLVSISLFLVTASLDLVGAFFLLSLLIPLAWLTGFVTNFITWEWALLIAFGVQICSWLALLALGNGRFETKIKVGEFFVTANVYFRKGFFLGNNLGVEVSLMDRLNQFSIIMLIAVNATLQRFGCRSSLRRKSLEVSKQVITQLSLGQAPLENTPDSLGFATTQKRKLVSPPSAK